MLKNPKWLSFLMLFALAFTSMAEAMKVPSAPRPDGEKIKEARALADRSKTDEAAKLLLGLIEKETDKEKRALTRMALAVVYFRASRDADAQTQFNQALEEGLRIGEAAQFHLGLLLKKAGKNKEAQQHFEKVLDSKAPFQTELDARYQLAEIFVTEKNWKAAHANYSILQRKMKTSEYYPVILFNLMRAERQIKRKGNGCTWARELYSKYPAHPLVKDWGAALESNVVDGERLGCVAKGGDLKTRIRRLQLGGEADRAAKELKGMRVESPKEGMDGEGTYSVDSMLANHLVNEGHVEEAMKILLRHYEAQKNRPPFLNLFAKASSRAGDYQAAIGAYQRAYELAPRDRNADNALFQAAFTSYQIQDYDGATRRFQQLVRSFPGNKLARDAQWHLAWIRYLRGDYDGAYQSFTQLSKAPKSVKRRRGRRWIRVSVAADAIASERIRYWSAMSLLKLGRFAEATPLFQQLVRDPSIGYYAVLSYYRIQQIPGAKLPPGIETRLGLKKSDSSAVAAAPSEEELKAAAEEIEAAAAESAAQAQARAASDESGEADNAEDNQDGAADDESGALLTQDDAGATSFKDPGLGARFERARDFLLVGLELSARRELVEIEARARRTEDRKTLMAEYVQARNYWRSSTIGELGFGPTRLREGLRGEGRTYWEYAYPRAWESTVMEASKATSVPEEFIWGIMRAESQYRYDVQSPVGALGLMQIMPFTGRQIANIMSLPSFETRSLLEPETNIRLGSRYLQRLLAKFSGSIPLAAASYNAGPHRVHAWVKNFGTLHMDEFIEHIPYIETRNYVKKVVRNYQMYSLLYSGGTHSLRWLVQPVGVQVDDRVPTKEVW